MKRLRVIASVLIVILILACNLPSKPAPQPTPLAIATAAVPGGQLISSNGVEFVIPTGLGTQATATIVPEAPMGEMGESPAYLQFALQGYPLDLAGRLPQIRVYAVEELGKYNWGQSSLTKLRAILANPVAAPTPDAKTMPSFYNTATVIVASNLKPLAPTGVSGVRMFAAFGQAVVPILNNNLFYQFHGLTADGKFYVMALLPATAPFLQNSDSATLPADGVPLDMSSGSFNEAVYQSYLKKISEHLNAAEDADQISPTVKLMDSLIASLKLNSAAILLPAPMPTALPEFATPTPAPNSGQPCFAAQYIADVTYPDNTEVKAGEYFSKTWRIKNTGKCAWEGGNYKIVFASGAQLNGTSPTVVLAAPNSVKPGDHIDVSIPLRAPLKKGVYEGYWHLYNGANSRIQRADGSPFQLTVKIVVKDGADAPILPVLDSPVVSLAKGEQCSLNSIYLVAATIVARGPYAGTYYVFPQYGNTSSANGKLDNSQGSFSFTAAGQTYRITAHLMDKVNRSRTIVEWQNGNSN